MANTKHTTETIAVDAHEAHHEKKDLMAPEAQMMLFTWMAFFIVLVILNKFAWKPILSSLDAREKSIQDSVEKAEKIREEMEKLEETRTEILNKATTQSNEIVAQARKAAEQAAKHLTDQAREESKILLDNAKREIHEEQQKAIAILKETSADIAINIASKLIEENLDKQKNAKLINQYLEDLPA